MKYVAAYALLVLGGKEQPTADDLKGLLKEVGVDANQGDVDQVVNALKGKKLQDVIAEGSKQVQNLSFGGSAAPAQATTSAPVQAAKQEEKAKPVEKAPEPEEDVDMGGLFD
ncbi:hypothetical protein pb186bvf_019267 [Paramecium bursaria]